jgi:Tfp pilus assembly protein PilO
MKLKIQLQPKSFFLLSGAIFLAGMGIVYLTSSSLGEQRRSLETLKSELKDEKAVQRKLDESKAKIAGLKSKLSHLEHGIPEAAYLATMLHELEEFGKKNNMLILSVRPFFAEKSKKEKEGGSKSAYQEQNITVKGRGTYRDALRFVEALKNFPKIVAVKSFTIVPKDSGKIEPGSPPLEFDISLQAYAFKDSVLGDTDENMTASRQGEVKHES